MNDATALGRPGASTRLTDHDDRRELWLTLIIAAATGVAAQQVIKHDAEALGMSRLELKIVLAVVGSVASRVILRAAAARVHTDNR
jgi:hypothetical protein